MSHGDKVTEIPEGFEIIAGTKLKEAPSAPDLKGFASRQWIMDLLTPEMYISNRFFGGTIHKDGDMYRRFLNRKVTKYDNEEKEMLKLVAFALSAEAKLPLQAEIDKADAEKIQQEFLSEAQGRYPVEFFHNINGEEIIAKAELSIVRKVAVIQNVEFMNDKYPNAKLKGVRGYINKNKNKYGSDLVPNNF